MPTIHREAGFSFVIYFDDHAPAHVHVWAAGATARIRIGDESASPAVMDEGTMRPAVLRRARRIVERHQERFLVE